MNQRAFTLIELLVVVAIIGILAAVGVVGAQQTRPTKFNNGGTLSFKEFMQQQLNKTSSANRIIGVLKIFSIKYLYLF